MSLAAHNTGHPESADVITLQQQWGAVLRRGGFRVTPQRQLVLEAVLELGHATPELVAERVQRLAPSVNLSTVYRTLDVLEAVGLVSHAHLGHGAPAYHVTSEQVHVHLVCHSCGTVSPVEPTLVHQVATGLAADLGFTLDVRHLALHGWCASCVAAGKGAPE